MRPRAENWLELGGIGEIPEVRSGVDVLKFGPSLDRDTSVFNADFKLYSVLPFWKVVVVGGGGSAASSAGGSTPSSTHLYSFISFFNSMTTDLILAQKETLHVSSFQYGLSSGGFACFKLNGV